MSMNYSEKENQFLNNISNYSDDYKQTESYFLKFFSGEKNVGTIDRNCPKVLRNL